MLGFKMQHMNDGSRFKFCCKIASINTYIKLYILVISAESWAVNKIKIFRFKMQYSNNASDAYI